MLNSSSSDEDDAQFNSKHQASAKSNTSPGVFNAYSRRDNSKLSAPASMSPFNSASQQPQQPGGSGGSSGKVSAAQSSVAVNKKTSTVIMYNRSATGNQNSAGVYYSHQTSAPVKSGAGAQRAHDYGDATDDCQSANSVYMAEARESPVQFAVDGSRTQAGYSRDPSVPRNQGDGGQDNVSLAGGGSGQLQNSQQQPGSTSQRKTSSHSVYSGASNDQGSLDNQSQVIQQPPGGMTNAHYNNNRKSSSASQASSVMMENNSSAAGHNQKDIKKVVKDPETLEKEKLAMEEEDKQERLQIYVFVIRCIAYPFYTKYNSDLVRRYLKVTKQQLSSLKEKFQAFLNGELDVVGDEAFTNAVQSYYEVCEVHQEKKHIIKRVPQLSSEVVN